MSTSTSASASTSGQRPFCCLPMRPIAAERVELAFVSAQDVLPSEHLDGVLTRAALRVPDANVLGDQAADLFVALVLVGEKILVAAGSPQIEDVAVGETALPLHNASTSEGLVPPTE